jgi:hypothetical protein
VGRNAGFFELLCGDLCFALRRMHSVLREFIDVVAKHHQEDPAEQNAGSNYPESR